MPLTRQGNLQRWVLFSTLSGIALTPALFTPVVADDFVLPFNQILNAGLNPITIVRWAVTSAPSAGHFNFLGQIVGGASGLIWMLLISATGLSLPTVLAATKLGVFILSVCAGARFLREGFGLADIVVSRWRSRSLVGVALFATLQLHIPWSNDPVTSFPASGFASMAIGFWYLALVAGSARRPSWSRTMACAASGCAVILYYEINVAAVVAAAPLVLIWIIRSSDDERRLTVAKGIAVLAIPAMMTVALQYLVSRVATSYDGTTIASEGSVTRTFSRAILSSLPAAAWARSRDWLTSPVPIRTLPLVALGAVFLALWYLARAQGVRPPLLRRPIAHTNRLVLGALMAAPILYWVGSTGIQSLTKKIQDEVVDVGQVYNFYAVGVTCVALLVVMVGLLVPVSPVLRAVLPVAVTAMIGFASVQYLINSEIALRMNAQFAANNALLDVYSDQAPVAQRCAALRTWTAQPWPNYYENQMVAGLSAGYKKFHGQEFCPGYDRVGEGLAS